MFCFQNPYRLIDFDHIVIFWTAADPDIYNGGAHRLILITKGDQAQRI